MHQEDTRASQPAAAVPSRLIADMRALYGRKLALPSQVDLVILAAAQKRLGSFRSCCRLWIRRVVPLATAASLVLATRVGLFLNPGPAPAPTGHPVQTVGVSTTGRYTPEPVVGILFAHDGQANTIPLRTLHAGEHLKAPRQTPLRLRIWDRHDIHIEPGTCLAADRNTENGCTIALAAGQITASVHRTPDEGVFRVVTPQAVITVTGTVFTTSTDFDQTYLHVTQGTVTIGTHGNLMRQVSANQTWRTNGTSLAQVPVRDAPLPGRLSQVLANPPSATVESPWYRERFAPLLELRDGLSAQGVHVDDIELLAISAELWNIQHPKNGNSRIPPFVHRRTGLERAARWYECDVRWLSACTPADAARLTKESLDQGALVLAFGLAGAAVQRLDDRKADVLAQAPSWSYRFLGEPEPQQYPLCRIALADHSPRPEIDLIRQAIQDANQLLTRIQDRDYWVGLQAVQAWSEDWAAATSFDLQDPFLRILEAIGHLGPICRQHTQADPATRASSAENASVYARISQTILDIFTTSALEETSCAESERQLLADRLQSAVRDVIRQAGGENPVGIE